MFTPDIVIALKNTVMETVKRVSFRISAGFAALLVMFGTFCGGRAVCGCWSITSIDLLVVVLLALGSSVYHRGNSSDG